MQYRIGCLSTLGPRCQKVRASGSQEPQRIVAIDINGHVCVTNNMNIGG